MNEGTTCYCIQCETQARKIDQLELQIAEWIGTAEYQHFKDCDKNIFDVVLDIIKYSWNPKAQ